MTADTAGVPADEVERLLVDLYDEDIRDSLGRAGMTMRPTARPWSLPPVLTGLWFAGVSPGETFTTPAVSAVGTSTCVDHCAGDAGRLAAAVLADLVHGAVVARHLNLPLWSLIGTGQENRLVPGGASAQDWARVAERVRTVFTALAPPGSRIVTTDDEEVWSTLGAQVHRDRPALADAELDGLYHLDEGMFPRGTSYPYFYDYYRYNICYYRRPVLRALFGPADRGILVVENTQQIKAVNLARRLNQGWPTVHWVTVPAPSRSGDERVTRALGEELITLTELDTAQGRALVNCQPRSRRYWAAISRIRERLEQATAGNRR